MDGIRNLTSTSWLHNFKTEAVVTQQELVATGKGIDRNFSDGLKESEVNYIKADIYEKFGTNVNESNSNFECYIPGDVLYKMNKDTALKKKVYDILADYTSSKFQMTRKALNPPVKKVTLVFDKNGCVVATLEPDLDNKDGSIKSSSSKADMLQLLGDYELGIFVPENSQNLYQNLEMQMLMLSAGLVKKVKGRRL